MPSKKVWNEEKINFLKNNYQSMTIAEIAKRLQLNHIAIKRKAKELGLIKKRSSFQWTDKQIEWLKENYFLYSRKKLAEHIGCSEHAIQVKAKELNLQKPKNFFPKNKVKRISPEDEKINNFIKENYLTMHTGDIAKTLNISEITVHRRANKMNLTNKHKNIKDKKFSKYEDNILLAIGQKLIYDHNIRDNRNVSHFFTDGLAESIVHLFDNRTAWQLQRRFKILFNVNKGNNIEEIIKNFLNELSINYQSQVKISNTNYTVDFLLDNNIIIEVNGDYWHGNLVYRNKLNKIQRAQVRRDILKLEKLGKLGYKVYTLWERDIKRMPLIVKNHIEQIV